MITTDYINIGRKYVDAVNHILNSRRYEQMSTFSVDGIDYYCVLVMKGRFLEPHFGVFVEGKFIELDDAIKSNDTKKIKELIQSDVFVLKDCYTNTDSNFLKIVSYVFSILSDYLKHKPITEIKIMGAPRKFEIYKKLVQSNIEQIPYNIITDEAEDQYSDKEGNVLPAKAMILKYKFA